MKLRKVLSLFVALLMTLEVLPLSSLATEIADATENVETAAEAVEEETEEAGEIVEEAVEEEPAALLGTTADDAEEDSSDESGIATVSEDEEDANTVYINSVEDFIAFAIDVQTYNGISIVLNTDIDFSEISEYYVTNYFPLFSSLSAGFAGTFDGNGHTIYNVVLESTGSKVGLFAYVNGGTIKDLTVSGTFTGNGNVGAVAGSAKDGVISNCVSYGTISASYYAGGIVGYVYDTTVSNCTNHCDVTITGSFAAGGIVGYAGNDCIITGCSNYGDITGVDVGQIGGIVGTMAWGEEIGTIDNCYNIGTITGSSTIGGIVGSLMCSYTVRNCTNDGDVVGADDKIGGIIGYAWNVYSIENCCNNGNVSSSGERVGGIVGRTRLDGTVSGYTIRYDYITISGCTNAGNIYGNSNYIGGISGDACDVIMTDCHNEGSVNGSISSGNYIGGVTGYVYSGSSMSDCYNEGAVTGYSHVGGVVGYLTGGTVERCYNTASVTGYAVSNTAGVVGCVTYNTGYGKNITILRDSFNTGDVLSAYDGTSIATAGGIVGTSVCSYIENCYNAGNVTANGANSRVGAAIGSASISDDGNVSNIYYLDTSAGSATGASVVEAVASAITSKTEEEFNSGEVTYLLNGSTSTGDLVWYQTVVTGEGKIDQYPVLDDSSLVVVQITVTLDDETEDVYYTNVGEHIITVVDTENGSVSASASKATEGDVITLTLIPDSGYQVSDVSVVDAYGNEVVLSEDYTFTMPASGVIVTATFEKYKYLINIADSENGLVSSSASEAAEGDEVTLTVAPNRGYQASDVSIVDANGSAIELSDDYTFTMPSRDVTVTATFEKYGYLIDTADAENGTVYASVSVAEEGDVVTLILSPKKGYQVSDVSVVDAGGNEIELSDNYTFTMPASDVTISATFEKKDESEADDESPVAVINPEYLIAGTGVDFQFSGTSSTDNTRVTSYYWNFGDGSTSSNSAPLHAYSVAGTYTVSLTVADASGNSDTVQAEIQVVDIDEDSDYAIVEFTVVDSSTAGTVSGAIMQVGQVIDDDSNCEIISQLESDSTGYAVAVLEKGTYNISVTASSYMPKTVVVNVDESGEYTIAISTTSLVVGEITATEMTYDEIVDAGIDVDAEENQHVWKFEATFTFTVGLETFDVDTTLGYYHDSDGSVSIGSGSLSGGNYSNCDGGWYSISLDDGSSCTFGIFPMVTEGFCLVVYGEAHWLKEMYNVELIVMNESQVETIEDCVATLSLPEGMSLATMVSDQQSLTVDLGTIGTNETSATTWYLCGDEEGEYYLTADVTGNWVTGNVSSAFSESFTTSEPVKIYAGSALHLYIEADDVAVRGEGYEVTFRLENVSDKSLYNLSFGITNIEQYKVITVTYDDITWENRSLIDEADFEDEMIRTMEEMAPGGYIEITVEVTCWFNSMAEVGEVLLDTYLKKQIPIGGSVLASFINIVYYLQDVQVATLEGSTTSIPYSVSIKETEKDSPYDIIINNLANDVLDKAIGISTSDSLTKELVKVIIGKSDENEEVTVSDNLVAGATALLSLVQGETDYTFEISMDDGLYEDGSISNEYIKITVGDPADAIWDMLNGTKVSLKVDDVSIQAKLPGSTSFKVSVKDSFDNVTADVTFNITVSDTVLEKKISMSLDETEYSSRLNENTEDYTTGKNIFEIMEEQLAAELEVYGINPFASFDSEVIIDVSGTTADNNFDYTINTDIGIIDNTYSSTSDVSFKNSTATTLYTISNGSSLVSFSADAFYKIVDTTADAGDSEFALTTTKVTVEQAALFGFGEDTYSFDITTESGIEISDFGGNEVTITLPYVLPDGADADDIVVIHLNENDGTYETIDATYDEEAQTVTFVTTHFSIYSIDVISSDDESSSVDISEAENGTVTTNVSEAEEGDTVTVSITPDDGYTVGEVTVIDENGNEIEVTDNGDGTYSFTMPEGEVTVTVTFEADDEEDPTAHAITITDPESGTITTDISKAEEGDTVTVTITPDDGYTVGEVAVIDENGDKVEVTDNGDGTYSFTMPEGEVAITVTFEADNEDDPGTTHTHTAGSAVRENVVAATATTNGSYDLVTYCTVCGEELSRTTVIVPATGMVDVWLVTSADYSAVNNAIAKANALNPSDYENFSAVTEAINAVNWNLKAINQLTVNAYADAINTAIDNLVEITANITEETVEIVDPIEDTNTDTEDDNEEKPSEISEQESNPITGIAFSILPMMIAALAAVSAKRK